MYSWTNKIDNYHQQIFRGTYFEYIFFQFLGRIRENMYMYVLFDLIKFSLKMTSPSRKRKEEEKNCQQILEF